MFERWAVIFAHKVKEANPEETEPHDVLVFGFTILFNLFFTSFLILLFGWILGVGLLTLQVMVSFMFIRLLTGGAHLDHSLACSITSLIIITIFVRLSVNTSLVTMYFMITLIFLLRYAPYYEPHQLKHSKDWERKKKVVAILWVVLSGIAFYFFNVSGFVIGALIQSLLVTPIGIGLTHKLNKFLPKGGE
ncbi:MAG: accessory gene regulator B family protein [Bacillaceae bacterium]|nr:accessory gene regulator B family protein [Bacillaceae bacterium]